VFFYFSLVLERIRFRCLVKAFPALGPIAILIFFFANLLATLSRSADLYRLRSSFERPANFAPSKGSPGTAGTVSLRWPSRFDFVTSVGFDEGSCFFGVVVPFCPILGTVLHRCTRSLRLANLSLDSSIAKISSMHTRS